MGIAALEKNPKLRPLFEMFEKTDGVDWLSRKNWCSDESLSDWYGVQACTKTKGITQIDLRRNRLHGPLPDLFCRQMPHLKVLILDHNDLVGSVPPGIGELVSLKHLDLSHNSLSGEVPDEIDALTCMRKLALDHNDLVGALPPGIGKLVSLKHLDLSHNSLSGEVPDEIDALT